MFCNIATVNKMAKIVLAGRSDCPYFARCELLGDELVKNLKKFNLHKIIIQPDQWEMWLTQVCSERGWSFKKSPIVWRELVDRGGKGVLIGGANDFQEYAKAYYAVESQMNSHDMETVSYENKIAKDICDQEERAFKALSKPLHICITNAISPVCYYLISSLCSGQILGPDIEFTIRLLVSSLSDVEQVKGTAMEAEDLACGLLRDIKVCTSPHDAFVDCSIILILDSIIRSYTDTSKSWIDKNREFFSRYATILNVKALKSCKVLLCGNGPVNFDAMIIAGAAPNISRRNIVAISSVIENQAKSVIAEKLNVNQAGVVNLIVWGNIYGKHHFDVSKCKIHGYAGAVKGPYWHSVDAVEMIHDNKWIQKDLPKLVQSKYHKIMESQGYMTGISRANAIASTLQNLCRGSPENQIFSLGVQSEGWYSVPNGIIFSFPVTMDSLGNWKVVEDIDISVETKNAIDDAIQDINYQLLVCVGVSRHTHTGHYGSIGTPKISKMASLMSWDILATNVDRTILFSSPATSKVLAELSSLGEDSPVDVTLPAKQFSSIREDHLESESGNSELLGNAASEADNFEPRNATLINATSSEVNDAQSKDDNRVLQGKSEVPIDKNSDLQDKNQLPNDEGRELQEGAELAEGEGYELQEGAELAEDDNLELHEENEADYDNNVELHEDNEPADDKPTE